MPLSTHPYTISKEPGLSDHRRTVSPELQVASGGDLTQRKMPGLHSTAGILTDCFQTAGLQSGNDNEQFPSEDELSMGRKGNH